MTTDSLEELLREVATFKVMRRGGVKLLDDRGDLIVEWPRGCPDPPTTREEAITKAIAIMRARGLDT